MRQEGVTFSNLDAEKYLEEWKKRPEQEAEAKQVKPESPLWQEDVFASVFCPWRRFFARMFDYAVYVWFWHLLLGAVVRANLLFWNRKPENCVWDLLAGMVLMVFAEPLFLHLLKTTPGKFLFGIFIEHPAGRKLTYQEALVRTWKAVFWGMGLNLPVWNLLRLWKSYDVYERDEFLPWEDGGAHAYGFRDTKAYRWAVWSAACLLLFLAYFGLLLGQLIPPNRGTLTVEEYAENVNYYAEYFRLFSTEGAVTVTKNSAFYYDTDKKCPMISMNPQGQWVRKERYDWSWMADYTGFEYILPVCYYEKDGTDKIREVHLQTAFTTTGKNWAYTYDNYQLLAALGIFGAKKSPLTVAGLLKDWKRSSGRNLVFEKSGIQTEIRYSHYGFEETSHGGIFFALDGYEERSYRMDFRVRNTKAK